MEESKTGDMSLDEKLTLIINKLDTMETLISSEIAITQKYTESAFMSLKNAIDHNIVEYKGASVAGTEKKVKKKYVNIREFYKSRFTERYPHHINDHPEIQRIIENDKNLQTIIAEEKKDWEVRSVKRRGTIIWQFINSSSDPTFMKLKSEVDSDNTKFAEENQTTSIKNTKLLVAEKKV
jgi:hypothetical protein